MANRSESSGPPRNVPPEITNTVAGKTRIAPTRELIKMKKSVGESIGRVICRNLAQSPAPSIEAAS